MCSIQHTLLGTVPLDEDPFHCGKEHLFDKGGFGRVLAQPYSSWDWGMKGEQKKRAYKVVEWDGGGWALRKLRLKFRDHLRVKKV